MKKLYTIDCPACRVLEAKLQAANIEYETITDESDEFNENKEEFGSESDF